ncbi:MAG TPA: excinuclease ABC subunit UvrA [Methylophilaceae bacterium]|nr:excinuclease ABC subunit UvrA [Methylophilaceae bacterium]
MDYIKIRGARTHNLKNISLDLPRNKLIVITGLSGSGKSSLAFDTLYAEGQRRYVESLSAYARQFLDRMNKPDVDLIEGLSPAISIEQKSTSHNPRSTVGTVTEIHDYLRLLFARAGDPHCPEHQIKLEAQTVSQMVDQILAQPSETKLMILAPVINERKGSHLDLIDELRAQGFIRIRLDGVIYEIDDVPPLEKNIKHQLDVVIDRIKIHPDIKQRLTESVESGLRIANGKIIALNMDTQESQLFSAKFSCPHCDYAIPELEPRLFSFNNPMGACPECDGLGHKNFFDANRVVAFPQLSLSSGAIKGWDKRNQFYFQMLRSLADHYKFDLEAPFENLPENIKEVILHGSQKESIKFSYFSERGTVFTKDHPFEGIISNFKRRYEETDSNTVREELAKYLSVQSCPSCNGTRLRLEARNVLVGEHNLHQICEFPLRKAHEFFNALTLNGSKAQVASKIIQEIKNRIHFLINVGLDYLSLSRSADTLSGGEAQRIRLASQIGSGLTGVMYVLDEPSIGLHQKDNDRLLETLKNLRDLGNTVIVVEHDFDAIMNADYVVDIGPGAGVHGGEIIAEGKPEEVANNDKSLTGQYLSGRKKISTPKKRQVPGKDFFKIINARGNNLKGVNLNLPIGLFTCITGVSGSGKSTLINDTLYNAIAKHLYRSNLDAAPHDEMQGLEFFDKVVDVNQSPIGRTPRSNPATYTGLFTPIRDLFAKTQESRIRGYGPGRFSFNVKGGRCEVCEGDGVIRVEMHFLPDVYVECDVCFGHRYNRETLDIRYKGKNIHEILSFTVEQAHEFFKAIPTIERKLKTLLEVGLGYIKLGQNATTLSGGEAQRVKLALELSKRDTGKTLYILDEPTTGLHFADIQLLLNVLHTLRDNGNTLAVIEHNLDVIKTADWIIDLGPEGGDGGGMIIDEGPPEKIVQNEKSFTGRYLKKYL